MCDDYDWRLAIGVGEIDCANRGLVWEHKTEVIVEQCKTQSPVLVEVEDREVNAGGDGGDADQPVHLLMEGDNYHSLSVLNYTHAGKVDVIYSDPPYNTGAKDWK